MTISYWTLCLGISFLAMLHVWLRRPWTLWKRNVFWSLAVWIPLLGPILYAGLYRLPGKHDALSQAAGDTHASG